MNVSESARGSRGGNDDVVVRKAEHGWVVGKEEVSDLTSAMVLADLFAADQDQAAYAEGRAAEAAITAARGTAAGAAGGTAATPGGAPATSRAVPPAPGRVPVPPATRPEGRTAISPGQGEPPRGPRFVPRETETSEAARLAVTVTQLEHALASRVRVEQAIGVLAERHRLRPREAFDLLRGAARSRGRRITEMAQDVVSSTANPLLRLPEELARQAPAPKQRGTRSMRRGRRADQP
jgi:hypothetical protein